MTNVEETNATKVIVYSSTTCPHCVDAKNYLTSKGIPYTEKNIQTDKAARMELMKMGHMGVPVIVIDGQQVAGFDKAKIDKILGL